MKKIFLILSFFEFLILSSCTKDQNNRTTPTTPFVPKDTLATGWKKITLSDSSDFEDIFFINNTGFVGGFGQNIFKSTDGGDNWLAIPKPFTGNPNTEIVNMGMGNEDNAIFVLPLNQLVATHNSGSNFNFASLSDNFIADVFFVDSAIAYAAGKNIWKTIDAGDNWTKLHDFPGPSYYYTLYFLNEQTGWVFRIMDGLYKTTNGGIDWQLIITPFEISKVGAVFFLNADTGYVSSGQNVEKTMDGGNSWTKVFSGTSIYHDIQFVSDKTGYITDSTYIYKTPDGGNTWTKEVSLVSSQLIGLHFIDPNHGWACGLKGTILKFSQ
jgi:photosystem II stability/assembly factor-like uncharacterized protein